MCGGRVLVTTFESPGSAALGLGAPALSHSPTWGRTTFLGKTQEAPPRGFDQNPGRFLK